MQPGDVPATYADIGDDGPRFRLCARNTLIDEGLPRFVAWYRAYHKV